jgi:hypothetical protein
MKRPAVTNVVLDGLNAVFTRVDRMIDDGQVLLSSDQERREVDAARRWLTRMFRFRSEELQAKADRVPTTRSGRRAMLKGIGDPNDPHDPNWAEAEVLEEQD